MAISLQARYSPLVLDIQPSHIRAVQTVLRRQAWGTHLSIGIRRACLPKREPGPVGTLSDDEISQLLDALERQGAVGRAMAIVVPSTRTSAHLLELPPRNESVPIERLARAEVARLCRWEDAQPFRMQHWSIPQLARPGNGQTVSQTLVGAVAMLDSEYEGLIAQLGSYGFSVVAAVPQLMAAVQTASEMFPAVIAEQAVAIIDVQWEGSSLTVVRDNIALYHRHLPDNGLDLLARGLSADLQITEAEALEALELRTIGFDGAVPRTAALCESFVEALAMECEATVDFLSRRIGCSALAGLSLVGEGTKVMGMGQALCGRLGITLAQPDSPASSTCALAESASRLLSRRPTNHGLLPRSALQVLQSARAARKWLATCLAAVVLCGFTIAGLYAVTWKPLRLEEHRLAAIVREQATTAAQMAAIDLQLSQQKAAAAFQRRMAGTPNMGDLLRVAESSITSAVSLTEVTVTDPELKTSTGDDRRFKHMTIIGTSTDAQALMDQMTRLKSRDVFEAVELARTGRSTDGRSVAFEMSLDVVIPRLAKGKP
jgi:hypothetical protein